MTNWFIAYGALHVLSFFIVMGFAIKKSESPFVDDDLGYWLAYLIIGLFFAPIALSLTMGYRLHGSIR